jgi:hypothetical protein
VAARAGAVLPAAIACPQHSGPELTTGAVNNAEMTVIQRLSKGFEREAASG